MDDGLVLNLAFDNSAPTHSKKGASNQGGRWTDRVKAKRAAKRKTRPADGEKNVASGHKHRDERSAKRPRREKDNVLKTTLLTPQVAARPPGQIISSLFSSNPQAEEIKPTPRRTNARPSNAPLTDSSSFTGLGLNPLIITHLSSRMDIHQPTSIQRTALPLMLHAEDDDSTRRDVFIQSQTGSGKTLSFLLPIIQDLLPLSSLSYIDRSIGTLAVIIAPTRELAKQISDVLESLLTMRLRPQDQSADDADATAPRLTRWLVSGLLTGGATRAHEKARLRKGVPILVSTPGRLLDHLQNTSSFNVGKCRWLVLDEADRLMDLGFEETITGIVKGLEGRRNLTYTAYKEGKSIEVGGWDWEKRRRTILCSATIRDDVQKLAGTTLHEPLVIKASASDDTNISNLTGGNNALETRGTKFTPPSQLLQRYLVVPLKLRLVTLVALLRTLLGQAPGRHGTKIIVFLSCTDSVDFHWKLLGGSTMNNEATEEEDGAESSDSEVESSKDRTTEEATGAQSALLPSTDVFRLHGSLALPARLSALRAFSSTSKTDSSDKATARSGVLLCTSVASRGLDLPLVRAVIQYDLPTEGGATEYLHRVGRTARAGKGGEAWSLVSPSEKDWVDWVQGKMMNGDSASEKEKIRLQAVSVDDVLQSGFGGSRKEHEERATEVQLSFERWVLQESSNSILARKAFLSHVRAYATHPSDEKHIFHVRRLQLGHLAKAFALREAPSMVTKKTGLEGNKSKRIKSTGARSGGAQRQDGVDYDDNTAEKRMQDIVRAQGRLLKKDGVMRSTGTSDFQLASGDALEKLVTGSRR